MDPEKHSVSKDSVTDNSIITSQIKLTGDEDYDPFEHRQVTHPTSTIGSFFHLLKCSLGSGLLAMPAAFKESGILPGCIGTILIGIIATHCAHVLIFDHQMPETKLQIEVYCCILLLPLILLTQLRYLKFLVPFSLFANVCLFVTCGITCYYTFKDFPAAAESKSVSSVKGWPLFISTAIFAMEGINVVMPIENEMAKPQHFLGCPGVMNITMVLITLLYGTMGLFGYLKYGDGVLGSVTLNLPQDEALALTAKVLVALAVFFTYSLQMYTPMDIIWSRIQGRISLKYHNMAQVLMRAVAVTFTVILAVAIPDLQLLIGVMGAIIFSTLGLFIPIAVQTVHKWDRGLGPFNYILFKNVICLAFYFVALSSGCYASISEIVKHYS